MVSVQVRREQVPFAIGRGLSQRRACVAEGESLKPVALVCIAGEERNDCDRDARAAGADLRFGTGCIRVMLGCDGMAISNERCSRLWAQSARRCRVNAVAGVPRVPRLGPRLAPAARNAVWSYDLAFDACPNGQESNCLMMIDGYTGECLAINVAGSIRPARVVEVSGKLISVHGVPRYMRSDNGAEFLSTALLDGSYQGSWNQD